MNKVIRYGPTLIIKKTSLRILNPYQWYFVFEVNVVFYEDIVRNQWEYYTIVLSDQSQLNILSTLTGRVCQLIKIYYAKNIKTFSGPLWSLIKKVNHIGLCLARFLATNSHTERHHITFKQAQKVWLIIKLWQLVKLNPCQM